MLYVFALLVHFKSDKPRTEIFSRARVPFYGRSSNIQRITDTAEVAIGYRMYNSFFPHRLRMSISYSKVGMNMPTFSRFGILLPFRRPRESSNRPLCRPSRGDVKESGHGSGKSKRNGRPRVDERASRRGEHSESQTCDETILGILHTYSR